MNKTKRAIFDSAVKVFSSDGYDGATVDDVAANAGVAKGTLYYHFKGKEDLFNFIVKEGIALISCEVKKATEEIEDPMECLRVSVKVQLKYVYNNKDLFRVIISQIWGEKDRHQELREQIKKLINNNNNMLGNIIDAGYIKEDSEVLSYCFIGVLFSAALYEILNEGKYDFDESAEKFINYIKCGINLRLK